MPDPQFAQISLAQLGSAFADVSVATLSAGQAAGTAPVLDADETRTAIFINPNVDGRLYFTGPATGSSGTYDGPYFNLYAGVPFVRTGAECPTGDLYVTGQAATTKLRIGKA